MVDASKKQGRLKENGNKVVDISRIKKKRQLKSLGHIMRKEGLGNLILTGHFEVKGDGRQRVIYPTSLYGGRNAGPLVKRVKLINVTLNRTL